MLLFDVSGMIPEAVTVVAGFQDVATMGEPVKQCGGHLGITKHTDPLGEAEASLVLKDVLDARTERRLSTIVISNRAVEEWDTAFKDAQVANELFERIFRKFIVLDLEERQPGLLSQPTLRPVTVQARNKPKNPLIAALTAEAGNAAKRDKVP